MRRLAQEQWASAVPASLPAPLLHGDLVLGWHDWPWFVALALVVGAFYGGLVWLNRRAPRRRQG